MYETLQLQSITSQKNGSRFIENIQKRCGKKKKQPGSPPSKEF
jgi:hypothetical protein